MITQDPRSYTRWKLEVEPQDTSQAEFVLYGDDLLELLLHVADRHQDRPVFRIGLWEWERLLKTPKALARYGPEESGIPPDKDEAL